MKRLHTVWFHVHAILEDKIETSQRSVIARIEKRQALRSSGNVSGQRMSGVWYCHDGYMSSDICLSPQMHKNKTGSHYYYYGLGGWYVSMEVCQVEHMGIISTGGWFWWGREWVSGSRAQIYGECLSCFPFHFAVNLKLLKNCLQKKEVKRHKFIISKEKYVFLDMAPRPSKFAHCHL